MSVKLRTPHVLTLLKDVAAPPAAEFDIIKLYARDAGGPVELFVVDANGNETQITDGGKISAGALLTSAGTVTVSGSPAPSAGQSLVATSPTSATWQSVSGLQLTSTDPVAVDAGAAALGGSTQAAKGDHKHSVTTGTPIALTVGGTNNPGDANSLARSNHTHALPAFGSSAGTFAQGDDTRFSNDRTASGLRTTTNVVTVSTAAAPSTGMVLTAVGPSSASWQLPTGGGGGGTGFLNYPFDLTRGNTDQAIPDEIATTLFNASGLTGVVRFVAVLECATSGQTASLELFNISDGGTVATVSTTNTVATRVSTAVLSLPGAEKLYGVRLSRTGGSSTDRVSCKLARFENTAV